MKPFNLERALAGDPVVDAEGNEYFEFRHLPSAKLSFQVVCVRKHDATLVSFTSDGRDTGLSPPMLFMAPKKRTVWGRVLRDVYTGELFVGNYSFESKEQAVDCVASGLHEVINVFSREIDE